MSRLIIKNLPPYLTPEALRKHFTGQASKNAASTSSSPSKTFTLTDAKIAYKPDGTSRRFGFVGFKTEKEAEEAKRWFDKSFIDSMRINVEAVDGIRDKEERPAKRRKLEVDSSPPDISSLSPSISKRGKNSKPDDGTNQKPAQADKDFEEYQKVMQSRTGKGPSWANEPQLRPQTSAGKAEEVGAKDDQMDDDPAPPQETLSDLEWMRQRMAKSNAEDSNTIADPLSTTKADANQPEVLSSDPTRDTILKTSRLFVRNLAYSCTDDDLKELFGPFGEISQVRLFSKLIS